MDQKLIEAFNLIYEAIEKREGLFTDAGNKADLALQDVAVVVLTEDEFIEYTEGYDKDGNAVIGR